MSCIPALGGWAWYNLQKQKQKHWWWKCVRAIAQKIYDFWIYFSTTFATKYSTALNGENERENKECEQNLSFSPLMSSFFFSLDSPHFIVHFEKVNKSFNIGFGIQLFTEIKPQNSTFIPCDRLNGFFWKLMFGQRKNIISLQQLLNLTVYLVFVIGWEFKRTRFHAHLI